MEVYETLKAAALKRYGRAVDVVYVDVDDVIPSEAEEMADVILAQDKWLPVVTIGDEIVCEGVLRLPDVWKALQRHGVEEKA